jgi:hypothetical protein
MSPTISNGIGLHYGFAWRVTLPPSHRSEAAQALTEAVPSSGQSGAATAFFFSMMLPAYRSR